MGSKRALVVSTPAILEARNLARWISREGIRDVTIDRSNGEWGVFAPVGALGRARAAFKKVISNPAGPFAVLGKGPARGAGWTRHGPVCRKLQGAISLAHDAVRRGPAVKALVVDLAQGKVRFAAFRRGAAANPVTPAEARDVSRMAALMRRAAHNPRVLLLTQEDRRRLPPLYSQENVADPVAQVKFFTPDSNWTWYATEFDQKDTFFGLVQGHAEELGYFSLSELSRAKGPMGLPVERDIRFRPTPLSRLRKGGGPLPNRKRQIPGGKAVGANAPRRTGRVFEHRGTYTDVQRIAGGGWSIYESYDQRKDAVGTAWDIVRHGVAEGKDPYKPDSRNVLHRRVHALILTVPTSKRVSVYWRPVPSHKGRGGAAMNRRRHRPNALSRRERAILQKEAARLLSLARADERAGHGRAAEYWKGKAAGLCQAAVSGNPEVLVRTEALEGIIKRLYTDAINRMTRGDVQAGADAVRRLLDMHSFIKLIPDEHRGRLRHAAEAAIEKIRVACGMPRRGEPYKWRPNVGPKCPVYYAVTVPGRKGMRRVLKCFGTLEEARRYIHGHRPRGADVRAITVPPRDNPLLPPFGIPPNPRGRVIYKVLDPDDNVVHRTASRREAVAEARRLSRADRSGYWHVFIEDRPRPIAAFMGGRRPGENPYGTRRNLLALTPREIALIDLIPKHSVEKVERRSPREFDLILGGTSTALGARPVEFSAWLPLLAIAELTRWPSREIAQMTDYPEMVMEGDWSGIRDSSREKIWAIFGRFVLPKLRTTGQNPRKRKARR